MVDRGELVYYGITNNFETRKKEHIGHVLELFKSGKYKLLTVETKKLNVHHKVAAFISRYNNAVFNQCRVQFSICYTSDCLEDAKEVELFLIKKAKKEKRCCNTKITY